MDMDSLLPYAVSATAAEPPLTTAAIAAPSEPGSPSSSAFSAGGGGDKEARSGSSPSPSAASSSSSTSGHFNLSMSRRQSPPASPLCFGAGGAGMLLWSSSKALARKTRNPHPVGKAAPNGDVVGRFLRRISRRLRKARAAAKESSPRPPRRGAGADDTARERAEAVASAVAYCKETLRRGTPPPPPPSSSPSLDWWLHDMRGDDIIASAATQRDDDDDDDECRDRDSPRPRRDRFPLETQAEGTHCDEHSPSHREGSLSAGGGGAAAALCDESPYHGHLTGDSAFLELTTHARHGPRMRLPYMHDAREVAAAAAAAAETGKPAAAGELEMGMGMRGGGSELEFLETLDGDEELIDRHFITVQM